MQEVCTFPRLFVVQLYSYRCQNKLYRQLYILGISRIKPEIFLNVNCQLLFLVETTEGLVRGNKPSERLYKVRPLDYETI